LTGESGSASSPPDVDSGPVTTTVTRRVRPGHESFYEQYFVVEPNRASLIELAKRADAGDLKPAIDSIFSLVDAPAAFRRVADRGKRGKVVLSVSET
jgi:NADPH:quinone reductase-like Zn-dependent oxidoreductase